MHASRTGVHGEAFGRVLHRCCCPTAETSLAQVLSPNMRICFLLTRESSLFELPMYELCCVSMQVSGAFTTGPICGG